MLKKKQLQIKKLAALLIREIVNESIFLTRNLHSYKNMHQLLRQIQC